MTYFTPVILVVCIAMSLHRISEAVGEITCLSFEKNFQGSRGVWVSHENVLRAKTDCPSGQRCAKFSRPKKPYNSRLSIPRFAYSFSAWSAFALTFWFKTADDKTSLLFHNDLCKDHGSLTIMIYNSGMIIADLKLDNKKTATTVVFTSRNDWHHVAVVWTGRNVNTYMDGERKDSAKLAGGRIYNSWCSLVVAGHPNKASDDVFPYNGYMDQICMYGKSLNDKQVKYLYENPQP